MIIRLTITFLFFTTLASCKEAAPPPVPESYVKATKCSSDNGGAQLNLQDSGELTFFKDVLPILDSRKTGEVYKCTTCHSAYRQPDGSNSVDKIEQIISAISEGGSMPTSGDKVKPEYIEKIRQWQVEGFVSGDISQFKANIDNSSDANADGNQLSSENCSKVN
jgi:hypothetical protein